MFSRAICRHFCRPTFPIASLKNSVGRSARSYATRLEEDFPTELFQRYKKPWVNPKITVLFLVSGASLAYSDAIFDLYESFTTTEEDVEVTRKLLEYKLKNLPVYDKLAHPKPDEKWIQLRSWENFDRNILDNKNAKASIDLLDKKGVFKEEEYGKAALTNSTLKQKGGIAIEPVIFHNLDTDEGVTIVHVGYRLCGYPFLVHGGIIATLLNETFKRNASLNKQLDSNVKGDFKVDNLTIMYKRPTVANQFLIIKTKPVHAEDSKNATFESVVMSESGKVLVKSTALLVDTGRELKKLHKGWLR